MKLRERSISKFELEALFRDALNLDQIEQISNLIKLIGLYVFVDRSQLNELAERHFKKKIGLSYIRKAVEHNLVSEVQTEGDFDNYFFQLKLGGFIFLETIGYPHRKLKLDSTKKDREQILAINDYLIKSGHLLSSKYSDPPLFEPLFTEEDVVLFDRLSENEVAEGLQRSFFPGEELSMVYLRFTLEKIALQERTISSKAKGNESSFL